MSGAPPWPAERVARLHELCAQRPKLTAKQIACILGCSLKGVNNHRRRYGLTEKQDKLLQARDARTIAAATRSHTAQPDHASSEWGAMMIALYESSPDTLPIVWFGTADEYRCMQEIMSRG